MDREFMKSFYKRYYSDAQVEAVRESQEYIQRRNVRYALEEQMEKRMKEVDISLLHLYEKYLDACADEQEILLEEMYLLGAEDREKMLR